MMFRFLLVVAVLLVHGELRAEPSEAEKHGFAPKLIIYNAKGPADSCGPGCDRWIAAEGEVDGEAAARVRRFLSEVKDPKRPIYFHSPGGVVEQSYVIGRLLRSRQWPGSARPSLRRVQRGPRSIRPVSRSRPAA